MIELPKNIPANELNYVVYNNLFTFNLKTVLCGTNGDANFAFLCSEMTTIQWKMNFILVCILNAKHKRHKSVKKVKLSGKTKSSLSMNACEPPTQSIFCATLISALQKKK